MVFRLFRVVARVCFSGCVFVRVFLLVTSVLLWG